MLHLHLVIHNHQPLGNLSDVFREAYETAYKPFLDVVRKHPGIKWALHSSGCLWEWLEQEEPGYLDILREEHSVGRLEFISGGMWEPIQPLIDEKACRFQFKLMREFLKTRFGVEPSGSWTTERIWEPSLAGRLSEAGIRFTFLDDSQFRAGLPSPDEHPVWGYYRTEHNGRSIAIFPINEHLRYLIPFRKANEVVRYLVKLSHTLPDKASITYGDDGEKFKKYWPAALHCVGKDILRFHALLWPAMLLSAKLPLPKKIFVHGYLTSGGQKMSKSIGNVVDPFEVVEKYGAEATRYFLLREFSSTEDGDFNFERFEERYNADLANGLGNLVSRVLTLAEKSGVILNDSEESHKISTGFGVYPERSEGPAQNDNLTQQIKSTKENYKKALGDIKFNEALEEIWKLISACDEFIEENKPWELQENNEKKFKEVISDLLISIKEIANLLKPFMPETADKILGQIKQNKKTEALFPRL